MPKTFRVRYTLIEGRFIDPDVMEVYNIDDSTECYPTGPREFRGGQFLGEDDFILHAIDPSNENNLMAFRKRSW